jgi:ABC-type nitrate/sulfonate/bicarbonate transport system permease component
MTNDRRGDQAIVASTRAVTESLRPTPPSGLRRRLASGSWQVGFISLAVGALLWQVVAVSANMSFFPPLSAVIVRLGELLAEPQTWEFLFASLTNLIVGFAISLSLGLGIGLLMGMYRRVDMALDIYVRAMLTAPSLVFAPILFVMFGLNRITVIVIVVLYSMFIIILNTASAVKGSPGHIVEMARSYGANDRYLFRKVLLPAAMPLIMAGVRLGVGRAVKGMINGEMFIAVVGLGGVVMTAGRNFDAETVLAVMLLIILIAFAAVGIVERVDRRLTSWLPENSRGAA